MRQDGLDGTVTVSFVLRFWLADRAGSRQLWRGRIIETRSGTSRFVGSPSAAFQHLAQRLRAAAGPETGKGGQA